VSDANALKLFEAAALLVGLVLFVAWQWRDLKRAQAKTARERAERAEREQATQAGTEAAHEKKSQTEP